MPSRHRGPLMVASGPLRSCLFALVLLAATSALAEGDGEPGPAQAGEESPLHVQRFGYQGPEGSGLEVHFAGVEVEREEDLDRAREAVLGGHRPDAATTLVPDAEVSGKRRWLEWAR